MGYIDVPVEGDQTDLAEEAFSYLETKVPGWLPSPGNLEAWLIESLAQLAGELRTLAALVPESIFAYFGESVLGLSPYAATAAEAMTTWKMIDMLGYTVDAGTVIAISPAASTDAYAFQVAAAFTVPAGQSSMSGVLVTALEPGAAASGLNGDVAVIDPLDFVQLVTLDGPTSGGTDAETPEAYLNRLSDLLTLLAPRPILPQDFAIMAQQMIPGVARATAVDLLNPQTNDTNCPRCVTVYALDANGQPVNATIKSEIDALLQSQREVNFLVFVADASYTAIAVTFTLTAQAGYVLTDVHDRVVAALESYLSPAMWGVPTYGDPGGASWLNATTVRYLEVSQVINNVDGVNYIVALAIGVQGGAMGSADVPLTGHAALPTAGTITGTVQSTP